MDQKDKDALSRTAVMGTVQNPLQILTYTIAAGAYLENIYFDFDYFRILSLSGGVVHVRFAGNAQPAIFTSAGLGYKCPVVLPYLQLFNPNANPITITIAVAIGDITDDRLNVAGTVITREQQASTFATSQVTLAAATATLISAADPDRAYISIKAGNTDSFYGTSAALTNLNGFKISAGQTYIVNNLANIYLYNVAGDTVFIDEGKF